MLAHTFGPLSSPDRDYPAPAAASPGRLPGVSFELSQKKESAIFLIFFKNLNFEENTKKRRKNVFFGRIFVPPPPPKGPVLTWVGGGGLKWPDPAWLAAPEEEADFTTDDARGLWLRPPGWHIGSLPKI